MTDLAMSGAQMNRKGRELDRMETLLRKHRYSPVRNGCMCGTPSFGYYEHLARLIVDQYWVEDE